MAVIEDVLDGVVAALKPKLTGLTANGSALTVAIGEGWPSEEAIQKVTKNNLVVVGVHDRSSGQEGKMSPRRLGIEKLPIGVMTSIADEYLNTTTTITLGYAASPPGVRAEDAVSLVLRRNGIIRGAVGIAVQGDTLASLATKLATEINANTQTKDWVSASASGAVVTVTNLTGELLRVHSYAGNVGILYKELGREVAQIQIPIWAGSKAARRAVSEVIQIEIGKFRAYRGFVLPSGERVRVTSGTRFTMPNDKDTAADVFRRDFIFDAHYSLTTTQKVYSVLVPVSRIDFPD